MRNDENGGGAETREWEREKEREREREREIGVAPEEIFARRSRHSRVRSFKSNYKVNLASLQNPL